MNIAIEPFVSLYKFDVEAYDFFIRVGLSHSLALEKAEQVSWLKTLASITRRKAIQLGYSSKPILYIQACKFFSSKNWSGWKSTNPDYLYKKVKIFKTHGRAYASLLSGKINNNNAGAKLSTLQKKTLIECYKKSQTYKGAFKKYTTITLRKIDAGEWTEKNKRGKFIALISLRTAVNLIKKNI